MNIQPVSALAVWSSGQVSSGGVGSRLMVIYSLQVTPEVVPSTQYSVVSVGVTEIVSVVSPVDQTNSLKVELNGILLEKSVPNLWLWVLFGLTSSISLLKCHKPRVLLSLINS